MKKKALVICLLAALLVAPAFAASTAGTDKDGSFGLGLNLGTNTGVGMKFGMGSFDVLANVGLDNFKVSNAGVGIGFDTSCSFQVYDFKIDSQNHMPLSVGLGVSSKFFFGNEFKFGLDVLFPVGLSYQFPKVPIELYLRLAPGLQVFKDTQLQLGFGMGAYIGALYKF